MAPEEVVTDGREALVAKVQSWKRESRSCLTVEAEPWKVRVTAQASAATLGRIQWLILTHAPLAV